MLNKTDEELAALGWRYVARKPNGDLAAVLGSVDDTETRSQIIEWLDDDYTVRKLIT